ncbi:uncharacterized protein LOC115226858 [Argonauta hians]
MAYSVQLVLCTILLSMVVLPVMCRQKVRKPYTVPYMMNVILPERYLPPCPSLDHVCGRVWRKGDYVQHLCACPGDTQCPMTWDSGPSGRSFQVRKFTQDKYCGPTRVERVCKPKEISFSVVSAVRPSREVYRQGVVCQCKSPYGVHQNAVYELRGRNDLKYVHVFSCGKLPKCRYREPCAQYFTNIKNGRPTENFIARVNLCNCPRPQHCIDPQDSTRDKQKFEQGNVPYQLHYCSA